MQSKGLLVDTFWFDIHHILSTSLILFMRILKNPSSTDLQEKAESMRHVLQEHPGKIQSYADECLKEILEDIRMIGLHDPHVEVSPLKHLDRLLFDREKPASESESECIEALKEKELLKSSEFALLLDW
ncbi:hypothetical protein yc1106_06648 [Curvularia clavata]|uniref:Uncharacterized protein n=1 Tax=Curvularia clavata TaxID=95742 RepID=A0A9Q9DV15_CURCL|nr:hypothetical protein yc1106_06648 [Curvularia clavata]